MFKKTLLALAVAAAAAPAMAAIGTQASGNGEVFVVASNFGAAEASRVTYVFDTGLGSNTFLPGATGFTTPMTGWSSFLSSLSTAGGNIADVRFSVFALGATNNNPSVNPGALRLLTSSTIPAADAVANGDDSDLQNNDLAAILSQSSRLSQFLNATNLRGTHTSAANGFSVSTRSGATDQGDYSNAFLDNLSFSGGEITFTTSAGLGETIGFLRAVNSAGAAAGYGTRAADVVDYVDSTFSVLNDGTLVFAAPIPEPGEIAFMLSGLGLAGLVARRRAARRA